MPVSVQTGTVRSTRKAGNQPVSLFASGVPCQMEGRGLGPYHIDVSVDARNSPY